MVLGLPNLLLLYQTQPWSFWNKKPKILCYFVKIHLKHQLLHEVCLDSSNLSGSDHYLPLFHDHFFLIYLCFTPKALLLLICLCIQAPVCMHAQLCSTHCDPVDCSPPGSSVHGIFHAGTLEWIAISYSRGCSNPGIEPACLTSRALAGGFFTTVLIQAPSGIIQAPSGIKVLFPKCSLKQWFPLT